MRKLMIILCSAAPRRRATPPSALTSCTRWSTILLWVLQKPSQIFQMTSQSGLGDLTNRSLTSCTRWSTILRWVLQKPRSLQKPTFVCFNFLHPMVHYLYTAQGFIKQNTKTNQKKHKLNPEDQRLLHLMVHYLYYALYVLCFITENTKTNQTWSQEQRLLHPMVQYLYFALSVLCLKKSHQNKPKAAQTKHGEATPPASDAPLSYSASLSIQALHFSRGTIKAQGYKTRQLGCQKGTFANLGHHRGMLGFSRSLPDITGA